MRKFEFLRKRAPFSLSAPTRRLLSLGLCLIYIVTFFFILELEAHPVLSLVALARLTYMLEHIVAATALLTAGSFLVEKQARRAEQDRS